MPQLLHKIEVEEDQLDYELEELLLDIENFTEKSLLTVETHERLAEYKLIAIVIASSLFALFLSTLIITSVCGPLDNMKGILKGLASGVTQTLPPVDIQTEMGRIFDSITKITNNLEANNKIQGLLQFDLTGHIVSANALILEDLGYSEAELVGQHHDILLATHQMGSDVSGEASGNSATLWERLVAGESYCDEVERVGHSGEILWFQASYLPILGIDGSVDRIVLFTLNITKEVIKRKEVDLISLVAEKTDNLVIITDPQERIEYVNAGFSAVTGYSREEALGRKPGELLQGRETDANTRAEIRRAIHSRQPFYNEIRNYDKSGQPYWVSISINPVMDAEGNVERFVSIQSNITEEKLQAIENEQGTNESVAVLERIAGGDLRTSMQGQYKGSFNQIQNAINETVRKLVEITQEIKGSSDYLSASAGDISKASEELSNRTVNQATTLEETNAAMGHMVKLAHENADSAKSVNQYSQEVKLIAEKGGNLVEKLVLSMNEISASSEQISSITSVINDIAFQTNLLALNAAVEAARAGDTGKGFAVVAQEVRGLAGRSSEAAKQISTLINDSQEKVIVGAELAEEAGESLQSIVHSFNELTMKIGQITEASDDQMKSISEIGKAISELDSVTQQNTAVVQESSSSALMLVEVASKMKQMMNFFKVS